MVNNFIKLITNPDAVKTLERLVVFSFGVIFVSVLLVLAFVFPETSGFAYYVSKVILALSVACVGTLLSGNIKITVKGEELRIPVKIRAGGGFALFVIIFFYSPADMVVSAAEQNKLTGSIRSDLNTKDFEKAKSKILSALIKYPEEADFHNLAGIYFSNIRNYAAAQFHYLIAVEMKKLESDTSGLADIRFNLAFTHTMLKQPEAAVRILEDLKKNASGDRAIAYNLAVAYMHSGNFPSAEQELNRLVDLGAEGGEDLRWQSYIQLGVLKLSASKNDSGSKAASDYFRKAACLRSDLRPLFNNQVKKISNYYFDRELEIYSKYKDTSAINAFLRELNSGLQC